MMHAQVKVIGNNGQVSLGKEFAGKTVLIDQLNEGTWVIKSGEFVPHSERWIHEKNNAKKLNNALAWAANNPPKDSFDKFVQEFDDKNG